MNTLMREAVNSYLERIKSVFPSFQRFGIGSDAFDADERDYKFELIRLFQSTVASRLAVAHATRSMPDGIADGLIEILADDITQNLKQQMSTKAEAFYPWLHEQLRTFVP